MAMAVAASIAPKEDLPVIYKNYYNGHTRLYAIYRTYGYLPTSINSNNQIIDQSRNDTALVQFILANVLLSKSYEINEQSSASEKAIIDESWQNIQKTNIGPIFTDVLAKQLILRGYIIEIEDEYDATQYKDFNDFYEHAGNKYIFESKEDENYLKKQYFSAFRDLSQFEMARTSESSEDYREYKILTEANKALSQEQNIYKSRITQVQNSNGTKEYLGTELDVSRYEAIESSILSNQQRIDTIFSKYNICSKFAIDSFAILKNSELKSDSQIESTYLTIPLSVLIDMAYKNHDSYLIWSSAVYAIYHQNEPYMTGEEWNKFNEYVELNEKIRAINKEHSTVIQQINILKQRKDRIVTPSESNQNQEYFIFGEKEQKELDSLITKKANLSKLKTKYMIEVENYRKQADMPIIYYNSRYYNDGVSPFYPGYYEWNLIDTIAHCIYLSTYNKQVGYSGDIYTTSLSTLYPKDNFLDATETQKEINELNAFRKVYVNTDGRLSNKIETYPEDVRAYNSQQMSDLYFAKAEFHLNSISDQNIRNAVYLASVQQARVLTLAIPHKEVYIYYDKLNNPYVRIHYTKNVDVETFNRILEAFSGNPKINEELAIIANWDKRTTAEYLVKKMYSTSSILAADVAINNLIAERKANPTVIPITTNDVSILLQNPLIKDEQLRTLHSLLNDNSLDIAKTSEPALQDLRYFTVDRYYNAVITNSGMIFAEYNQWKNDDVKNLVNQNNLVTLTNNVNIFIDIYQNLPDDKKEKYEIPYDSERILPMFAQGATKYQIAKTIVTQDIKTTPELRLICEETVKEYEYNIKKKNLITYGTIALVCLLILGLVYIFWYRKRPIVKVSMKESASDYEIKIINKGMRPALLSKSIHFKSNILPPTLIDPKLHLTDYGDQTFTVKGTLEPGENKVIMVKKTMMSTTKSITEPSVFDDDTRDVIVEEDNLSVLSDIMEISRRNND